MPCVPSNLSILLLVASTAGLAGAVCLDDTCAASPERSVKGERSMLQQNAVRSVPADRHQPTAKAKRFPDLPTTEAGNITKLHEKFEKIHANMSFASPTTEAERITQLHEKLDKADKEMPPWMREWLDGWLDGWTGSDLPAADESAAETADSSTAEEEEQKAKEAEEKAKAEAEEQKKKEEEEQAKKEAEEKALKEEEEKKKEEEEKAKKEAEEKEEKARKEAEEKEKKEAEEKAQKEEEEKLKKGEEEKAKKKAGEGALKEEKQKKEEELKAKTDEEEKAKNGVEEQARNKAVTEAREALDLIRAPKDPENPVVSPEKYPPLSFLDTALIDQEKKVIMGWAPRAASAATTNMFLESTGLYTDEAKEKYPWIHDFRESLGNSIKPRGIDMNNNQYFKFKVVRNPYARAVSSWLHQVNTNFSYDSRIQEVAAANGCSSDASFVDWLKFVQKVGWIKLDAHSYPQFSFWEYSGGRYEIILQLEDPMFDTRLEHINLVYGCHLKFETMHVSLLQSESRSSSRPRPLATQLHGVHDEEKFTPKELFTKYPEAAKLVEDIYQDDFNVYGYPKDVTLAY